MENIILSLSVLITGLVVVFFVLFLLVGVIKLYSAITRSFIDRKKSENCKDVKKNENIPVEITSQTADNAAIPEEVIAVIAAAVNSLYGEGYRVKSLKRINPSRLAWREAGIAENNRPFLF